MSDLENSNVINTTESTEKPEQKVEVETNGQLRIVFEEEEDNEKGKINDEKLTENDNESSENETEGENNDDLNQDNLYKFDPEIEHYWNR